MDIAEKLEKMLKKLVGEMETRDLSALTLAEVLKVVDTCARLKTFLEKAEDEEDDIDRLWAQLQKEEKEKEDRKNEKTQK